MVVRRDHWCADFGSCIASIACDLLSVGNDELCIFCAFDRCCLFDADHRVEGCGSLAPSGPAALPTRNFVSCDSTHPLCFDRAWRRIKQYATTSIGYASSDGRDIGVVGDSIAGIRDQRGHLDIKCLTGCRIGRPDLPCRAMRGDLLVSFRASHAQIRRVRGRTTRDRRLTCRSESKGDPVAIYETGATVNENAELAYN